MIDVISVLTRALGSRYKKAKQGQEVIYHCPFCHHHKPKLQISLLSQKWHCWVCDKKGRSLYTLLKLIRAPKALIDEVREYKPKYKRNKVEEQQTLYLPKEFKNFMTDPGTTIYYKQAYKFLKDRGVDATEIARYGIGYCTDGPYSERIIIPSYDNDGILNYFTARSFTGSNYKYKNPPVSKDVIGFEFFVNWNEPIILCEGPFDALSIKRNAIPLFGKTIPTELLKKIYTKNVKEIYIVLDEDARKDSIKLVDKLMKDGIKAYFVQLQDKDPNELGFSKVWDAIHSTNQTTFSDFIKHRLYG
jgi:DNA primase